MQEDFIKQEDWGRDGSTSHIHGDAGPFCRTLYALVETISCIVHKAARSEQVFFFRDSLPPSLIPHSFLASARPVASNLLDSYQFTLVLSLFTYISHPFRKKTTNKMRSSAMIPLAAAVLPVVMARPNGAVFQRGWGGGAQGGPGGFGGGQQSAGGYGGFGGSSGPSSAGKTAMTKPTDVMDCVD